MANENLGFGASGSARTPLNAEERSTVVAEASRRAAANGTTPQQELYQYAKGEGLSNANIDSMMGFAGGTAANYVNEQRSTPLSATARTTVVAEADKRAAANGTTPEQELYKYAQSEGLSNANVDSMMGFGDGTTRNWLTQQQKTKDTALAQAGAASQAAPSTAASSQGYNATNTDLSGQFNSMGGSNPNAANAQLLSGQVNNQYLDAQANNIQTRLNRNLQENIMPGIGQSATGAGQYGSSRHGIAEGKAIADTQDNYAGQMANLYGSANEAAQNRMSTASGTLSGIGANVGMTNANNSNTANQFGANASNTVSMYNTGQANAINQFNAGQYNANAQFNAGQANSYNLGTAANANNANSTANSYALGNAANQNNATSTANSYALGNAANANNANATANSYALGNAANANNATANSNNYTLGQGNQYLTNQGQQQNFYTANRGLDQSGVQLGANLYNMGNTGNVAAGAGQTTLGNQYQNAPITALQNYSNTISPYSGLNSTQSTTENSGGGAMGTVGGALAGAQIGRNLGFGSTKAASPTNQLVTTGDYANIPAYMIQN